MIVDVDGYLCEPQGRPDPRRAPHPRRGARGRRAHRPRARHHPPAPRHDPVAAGRRSPTELGLDLDDPTARSTPSRPSAARCVEAARRPRLDAPTPTTADRCAGSATGWCPTCAATTDEIDNLLAGLDGRYVPGRAERRAHPRRRPRAADRPQLLLARPQGAARPQLAWDVGRAPRRRAARPPPRRGRAPTRAPSGSCCGARRPCAPRATTSPRRSPCSASGRSGRPSRGRVVGLEPIPLAELGRPRIDVTLRISGFFRDAFPDLVDLLDDAVALVAVARRAADAEPRAGRTAPTTPASSARRPAPTASGILPAARAADRGAPTTTSPRSTSPGPGYVLRPRRLRRRRRRTPCAAGSPPSTWP